MREVGQLELMLAIIDATGEVDDIEADKIAAKLISHFGKLMTEKAP